MTDSDSIKVIVVAFLVFVLIGLIIISVSLLYYKPVSNTQIEKNQAICKEMGLNLTTCYCVNGTCHKVKDALEVIFSEMKNVSEKRCPTCEDTLFKFDIRMIFCSDDEIYVGIYNKTTVDKYNALITKFPVYANLSNNGKLFLYHPIKCSLYNGRLNSKLCYSEFNIWIIANKTCNEFYFNNYFLLDNFNREYLNENLTLGG